VFRLVDERFRGVHPRLFGTTVPVTLVVFHVRGLFELKKWNCIYDFV
jgi:hypothetical protein